MNEKTSQHPFDLDGVEESGTHKFHSTDIMLFSPSPAEYSQHYSVKRCCEKDFNGMNSTVTATEQNECVLKNDDEKASYRSYIGIEFSSLPLLSGMKMD